jgi:two-component system, OmpR family, phosphate regulon sensor histidine kinase PhoR
MRKKIFWSVFALSALSVLLVFLSALYAVNRSSQKVVEERLIAESELLACMLKQPDDISRLKDYTDRDQFRITVIDADGNVLYENSGSRTDSAASENHSDRAEVIAALEGTPHTVQRYSATLGHTMTYYAVTATMDNGETIVVRLAVRSSEIGSFLLTALPFLLLALALSLILSSLLAGRLSVRVSDRIGNVAYSLRSLNEGKYEPLQTDSREPELYAVYQEINELNGKTCALLEKQKRDRERLYAVLDNMSQGMIAIDAEEKIVFANNSALHYLGGTEQDIGRPLNYLLEDSELCRRIRDSGADEVFDYPFEAYDFTVAVRHLKEEAPSAGVAAIVILTDSTAEKKIAREKSDFFANASHELKTPITVMQGLSELLLARPGLDETSRRDADRIHRECLRMADLIADMLRLSELEQSADSGDNHTVFDLHAVVDESLAELNARIESMHLTVNVAGSGKVSADPKKMYELVNNLLSNAVNYNKQGGRIDVTIGETEGHTVLNVRDTGIGIAREHLPRLCERFYRVDKSRSKSTGGTGLGLAIVKHICALYGAELKIDSEPDVGTTVTVRF